MLKFADDIDFVESGEGPAVLFIPGSFGTGAAWRSVISEVGARYRCVTTSLIGYGATSEQRPLGNATITQQIEMVDAIVERIGAPVHVVAHSFGGLSALAHLLEGHCKPASLVLVEANPLAILRTAGDDAHYQMFEAMTSRYFAAFAAGRPDAARRVIDFYEGDGSFEALPPRVRDYVVATTPSNIRDWSSGTPFAPTLEMYGTISIPTHIVHGGKSHPAMVRIAELLASNIPDATITALSGGRHFLPSTHAGELANLIDAHLQTVLGG